jgi:hypothetical protein
MWVLPVTLILLATALGAATAHGDAHSGPRFTNGTSAPGIPFEMLEGHVVIPVTIGGDKVLKLTIDSGIPFEGIDLFHQALADELISPEGRVDCSMPGVEFLNVRIQSIANQYLEEAPEDGLIGLTLFKSSVVEIDFENSVVNLHDPSTYDASGAGEELAIAFPGGLPLPHVKGTVSVDGSEAVTGYLAVDLGSPRGLILLPHPDGSLEPPADSKEVTIGKAHFGDIKGREAKIDHLAIGSATFRGITCRFMDQRLFARDKQEVIGFIGTDLVKELDPVFDYSRKKLYIKRSGTHRHSGH